MKTFREVIKEWMVSKKRNSIKASSYDRLESTFILMCKHNISEVTIDQIDTEYIQDYIYQLVDEGYALTTIKKQFNLITEYMDYANSKGIILLPYHRGVKMPARSVIKKPRKDVIAYNNLEQKRLNEVLYTLERPAYISAILMLETGMRIGEVLALGWDDFDLKRRAIHIGKTFVRLGNSNRAYIQNEPKSFSSIRTVPLSSRAFRLLSELKLRDEYGMFIVHDERGEPLTYEACRWQIKMACKAADVRYYGQHVFRHTFATNCYNKGCDVKVLSKFLGHANVNVTYNIYIHLFGDALEEMRSILD